MLEEHLANPRAWFGALLVLGFFFLMWRFAAKPGPKKKSWDYSYEFVSEPADAANPELAESFASMLKRLPTGKRRGAHLIRLAVMNRGAWRIRAEDHLRPLTVAFPAHAKLLDAAFAESFGPAPERAPEMTRYERGVEIAPFEVPVDCALVFQLVVAGADAPSVVDGGIEGQAAIERLS